MRRYGVVVLGLLAALLMPAETASAASDEVSVKDGLAVDCADASYRWSIVPPAGYGYDVTITFTAYDPIGDSVDQVFEDGASGKGLFLLCMDDVPLAGRYRVTSEVAACNEAYDCQFYELAPTSFRLRAPRTKTWLKASPKQTHKNQVVTFRIDSSDEYLVNRFGPTEYADVALQVKEGGRWRRVRGSLTYTNKLGRAFLYFRVPGTRISVRAVTLASDTAKASSSRPVVLT